MKTLKEIIEEEFPQIERSLEEKGIEASLSFPFGNHPNECYIYPYITEVDSDAVIRIMLKKKGDNILICCHKDGSNKPWYCKPLYPLVAPSNVPLSVYVVEYIVLFLNEIISELYYNTLSVISNFIYEEGYSLEIVDNKFCYIAPDRRVEIKRKNELDLSIVCSFTDSTIPPIEIVRYMSTHTCHIRETVKELLNGTYDPDNYIDSQTL